MGGYREKGKWGRGADAALIASIVLAPVAGAGVSHEMLPVLAVLATEAFVLAWIARQQAGRRVRLSLMAVVLAALAGFSVIQAISLPAGVLRVIAPRVVEIRGLVGAAEAGPISYEYGATLRDAAKLLIYGMIVQVARDRAEVHGRARATVLAVAVAGIASAFVAFAHRAFGIERMLGFLPSMRPASKLLTTFVNPNHGAGFMMLATFCAVALAASERRRKTRTIFFGGAVFCAVVSVLCFSRGGMLAFLFGILVLVVLMRLRLGEAAGPFRGRMPLVLVSIVVVPLGWVAWRFTEAARAFAGRVGDPLGVEGKLAAVRDAWPLILDHAWFGIGRGAYESVYPGYKSTPFQFTYTHSENVFVQLVADWGVPVGIAVVAALIAAIVLRLYKASEIQTLAPTVGIAALTLQNLVDFSLEVPGAAIPTAALLGAVGVGAVSVRKVTARSRVGLALLGAPVVLLAAVVILVVGAPKLDRDLEQLESAAFSDTPGVVQRMESVARAHPANAIAAARMAFVAETAAPPDHRTALRWANRTLYLAPSYAGGHLVTGRLLLRLGQRRQAFEQMRKSWELSSAAAREGVIRQIIGLARSVGEVVTAAPRRDLAFDVPSEVEIARAAKVAVRLGNKKWGQALLDRMTDPSSVPLDNALRVASAALENDRMQLAVQLIERRRAKTPNDQRVLQMLVRAYEKQRDDVALAATLDQAIATLETGVVPFYRRRLALAIKHRDLDLARRLQDELQRRMPPTRKNQVRWARSQAQIESLSGDPSAALRSIDRAIQLDPTLADDRVTRARLLLSLGRRREAENAAESALRLREQHPAATALLRRIRQGG